MAIKDYLNKAKMGFKLFGKAIWKFFVGGLIVIVAFLANFIDLKQPNIYVDISEIDQSINTEIDVKNNDSLKNINLLIKPQQSIFFQTNTKKYTIDEIDDYLKREEDSLSFESKELNSLRQDKNINSNQISVKEDIYKKHEELVAKAKSEVLVLRDYLEKNETKITVTAIIANRGDGSTSIKPQAILRADFGSGSYFDIPLKIQEYNNSASISPRSSNMVKYSSQKVNVLSSDDRDRFIRLIKNPSPAKLIIADVYNNYFTSNTISFANGLYEQSIYDNIKKYASSKK
jgi:hypothetical protein